jgi:hypothetical protein
MDTSLSMAFEQLADGSLLTLREAQGRGVAVFSGCLWITQEGDRRDLFVAAGDSLRFDRAGLVVMQALADTRLLLLEPIEASAPTPRPGGIELHREARRQRSLAIGEQLLRLVAWLGRPWVQA